MRQKKRGQKEVPAEASSSCPSDAKREATNANARYGVDDPFDRERPPPTERHTKETSSNDDSKAALALGRPSHDGTLCPARDKKVCDDDSKEEETFARSMMMMISTRSRFTRTDDESVRRFLPLENGRRDVFGLVSLLLLLERGGGFFRRFVAIAAASVAARRCHVSLSLVDEDGFDGRKKSEEEKEEEKNS